MHVHHQAEFGGRELVRESANLHSRRRNHDVDAVLPLPRSGAISGDLFGVREVRDQRVRFDPGRLNDRRGFVEFGLSATHHDDVGTSLRQCDGNTLAKSSTSTGHQRNLAVQAEQIYCTHVPTPSR